MKEDVCAPVSALPELGRVDDMHTWSTGGSV